MAGKKTSGKMQPKTATEAKVVALAEQLGWFLGTAKAKADGWIGNPSVRKELTSIRDGAAKLLQHIDAAARAAVIESARPKVAAKSKSAALKMKPDRGPVDAPGKRHRKPPPNVNLTPAMKRMGEPVGKQMGQKNFKMGHGKKRITG